MCCLAWSKLLEDFTECLVLCRLTYGGSLIRPESTGFGTVYFCVEILKDQNTDLKVTQNPLSTPTATPYPFHIFQTIELMSLQFMLCLSCNQ